MTEEIARFDCPKVDPFPDGAETAYVSGPLRDALGATLRPGGLELTDRGVGLAGLARGARVLDVACGPGASVAHLRARHGLRAFGVDRSATLLAQGLPAGNTLRAEATDLPFPDSCFDAVLCECVVSLFADQEGALRELFRVLVPGGRLLVTDMYVRGEAVSGVELPAESCLRGARRRTQVEGLLRSSGFTPLTWEDHTPHLRRLLVQLIFSGAPSSCRQATGTAELERMRPGYYLLVARKAALP